MIGTKKMGRLGEERELFKPCLEDEENEGSQGWGAVSLTFYIFQVSITTLQGARAPTINPHGS